MRYLNESDVRSFEEKRNIILESCDINKATYVSSTCSVFLSHSSKDKPSLKGVVAFLRSYGAEVYIDLNDKSLPLKPSPETAKKLKIQMKRCSKAIVFVSENSKDSKWIPWEVGLADMDKTPQKIALLPKTEYEFAQWPKQEYMGLYNRIINDYGMWYVQDPETGSKVLLESWLKS